METVSALLAICAVNSPVPGEFTAQRPVTRSFDVSLIYARINGWVNNGETGDLRRHRAHYDVIVMGFNYSSMYNFNGSTSTNIFLIFNLDASEFLSTCCHSLWSHNDSDTESYHQQTQINTDQYRLAGLRNSWISNGAIKVVANSSAPQPWSLNNTIE